MRDRPSPLPSSRLCIKLASDGLTVYGNSAAMVSLRDELDWLSESDPSHHFECHVTMTLEDDQSRFHKKRPRNVWTLVSPELSKHIVSRTSENEAFELTFMVVEESDLDELAIHQDRGIAPEEF